MEAIMLGGFALGMIAWAWWSERKTDQVVQLGQELPIEKRVEEKQVEEKPADVKRLESTQMKQQKPQDFYERESMQIDRFWVEKKELLCGVVGIDRMPDYVIYELIAEGIDNRAIEKHISNLRTHLHDWRRLQGVDPSVGITFNDAPLSLEVTRPDNDRKTINWFKRAKYLQPAHLKGIAGVCPVNGRLAPVCIDLAKGTQAIVGIFGSTGSGKSVLQHQILATLLEGTNPDNIEVAIINTENNDFDCYSVLPHVRWLIKDENEAYNLLSMYCELIKADREQRSNTYRILVIEELQTLTEESEFADEFVSMLAQIAKKGRKHGFRMISNTQDPSGDNYPTALQKNTKVVFSGSVIDGSYMKKYLKVSGCSELRGMGDFKARLDGQEFRFKAFFLNPENDIERVINGLTSIHGQDASVNDWEALTAHINELQGVDTTDPKEEPVQPPRKLTRKEDRKVAENAQAIVDTLLEVWDFDQNKMKFKGWASIAEILFGSRSNTGGNYRKEMEAAVEYTLDEANGLVEYSVAEEQPMEWVVAGDDDQYEYVKR